MDLEQKLRQSGTAFLGFLVGCCAMFWVPWLLGLMFQESSIEMSDLIRLLGLHLFAALLLSGAYLLLYGVHLLLWGQADHPGQPFRLHAILGALAGALFYLLLALAGEHLSVVVLGVGAVVLAIHYVWERRRRGQSDWTG